MVSALTKKEVFLAETWPGMVDRIGMAFKLSKSEKESFTSCKTAILIGATPYEAGCKDPDRFALSHLSTYTAAASKGCKAVFAHRETDDEYIYARLATISRFPGGNLDVVLYSLACLGLQMIENYFINRQQDLIENKYNPLNSHKWDYAEKRQQLFGKIEAYPCPGIRQYFDPWADPNGWWNPLVPFLGGNGK